MDLIDTGLVPRFQKLFRGNSRSHGVFHPKTRRMETAHKAPLAQEYESHLAGETGLGIVPVMDDSTCWFGVIDIDSHGDAEDIDLLRLEALVREKDLPLVACRSKSGGAHLYVFGSEPLPAKLLRSALAKWAEALGHAGCEVFPKQDHLPVDSDGERQYGNWINLCWFDANDPDCLRYAVEGGKRTTLGYFLDLAESRKVSAAMLVERSANEHDEAPPCVQKMIANGVPGGMRNEALYNFVVYLKQAYPETWRDKAFDLNARVFDTPLEHAEAKKTITSAGRRDYRYKCKEEPCRSLCKSAICVTRKFGITPDEKNEMEIGKAPEFGPLDKHLTDPPRWGLHVGSAVVHLGTSELMDYRQVRVAIAEKMSMVVPPMKNDRWQVILHGLMQEVRDVAAPEEASTTGFIRTRLYDFFSRTDMKSSGEDKSERQVLAMGSPVVQVNESTGERCMYFRGSDFVDYLKKNRSEELKGSKLWMALRSVGVEHARMRVGDSVLNVWFVPLSSDDHIELSEPNMEPEL